MTLGLRITHMPGLDIVRMISILIRLLSSLLKVTAFWLMGTFKFQGFSFTSEI